MFVKRLVITILCAISCLACAFSAVGCSKSEFTVRFESGATDASLYYGEQVQTVSSSKEITEPIFVRPGYNFVGWNKSVLMLNNDSTVVAQWKAYEFQVTFYANGGVDGQGNRIVTLKTDSAYNLVQNQPDFVKEGYELSWDIDLNLIKSTCSVNAVWTPKKYDLVFKDILGNDFTENIIQIEYDQKIDEIAITPPHIQNQKFAYWKGKENGLPLDKGVVWKYDNNEIFEPVYIPEDEFLIKYDVDGGRRAQKTYSYKEDVNLEILENPSKDGYKFMGWLINDGVIPKLSQDITIEDFKENGSYKDVNLKAVWESLPYIITFNADGGSVLGEEQKGVWFGTAFGELPTAEKENYEFFGWEYDGEMVDEQTIYQIASDITLKAVYKAKYKVKFSLTSYVGKDNTEIRNKVVKFGDLENDGVTDFEEIVLELVEGQSLYSKFGIKVMPIVDPIERKGENEYIFGNYWQMKGQSGYNFKVNCDTIFNSDNLSGIKGGDVIILNPFLKTTWSPRY